MGTFIVNNETYYADGVIMNSPFAVDEVQADHIHLVNGSRASKLTYIEASEDVRIDNVKFTASVAEVILGPIIVANNAKITADKAIFLGAMEYHIHDSQITAPDIYIYNKGDMSDINTGVFQGTVHYFADAEELPYLIQKYYPVSIDADGYYELL
jgi:hypothetical protein